MARNVVFYDENARSFFDSTVSVDMSELYSPFLSRLSAGASILDAGCGSGRDAKAFHERGYRVAAFDASESLARLASHHCGFDVAVRTFADIDEVGAYDGVWCCASLLHVPQVEIPSTLARLWQALRPGGCLYVSFKLGSGERQHHGRTFTDADEVTIRTWLGALPARQGVEIWTTDDKRPGRTEQWINALVIRERP